MIKTKKRRQSWFPLKKRHSSSISGFFILLGVTATALILSIILQRTLQSRLSIVEDASSPDFSALLPEGGTKTSEPLALQEYPQPSYVVGYSGVTGPALALVVWDRDSNKYVLGSSVTLASSEGALGGVTAVEAQPLGSGATTLVLASGPSGAYTQGVFAVVREGRTLRLASMSDAQSRAKPAFFLKGASVRHAEELSFQDLDADGRLETVTTGKELAADGSATSTDAAVYRWVDGWLLYDKDLSWALTVSNDIFPEPTNP